MVCRGGRMSKVDGGGRVEGELVVGVGGRVVEGIAVDTKHLEVVLDSFFENQ